MRHATYIAEELATTGVVEVLSEALKVGAMGGLDTALHTVVCGQQEPEA